VFDLVWWAGGYYVYCKLKKFLGGPYSTKELAAENHPSRLGYMVYDFEDMFKKKYKPLKWDRVEKEENG